MKLKDAINTDLANQTNVNVTVWAIPSSYVGSQPRFDLNCEASIGLDAPNSSYKEVWYLHEINYYQGQGKTEQKILDMVHSFYRVPIGMTNPF